MNPVILSVETATLGGSVCISEGRKILASTVGNSKISHSNTLLSDIDGLFSETGLSLRDVEVFAVANGPGSFTGLRIGIATVKALANTLQRPCAGVPTLAAIAHSAGRSEKTLALLPAGRGEVFAQSFSVQGEGIVTELDSAVHLSPFRVLEKYQLEADLLFAGEGARVHLELIKEWANQHRRVWSESKTEKRGWRLSAQDERIANHVAALALQKVLLGSLEQPNSLQAIYVRPSDAEINQNAAK